MYVTGDPMHVNKQKRFFYFIQYLGISFHPALYLTHSENRDCTFLSGGSARVRHKAHFCL